MNTSHLSFPFSQLSVTSTNDSLKMAPPPPVFSSTLGPPSFPRTATTHGAVLLPSSSASHASKTTATTKLTVHVSAPKASSGGSHVTPPKATPSTSLGGPFTFAPPTQMSPARITTENCNKVCSLCGHVAVWVYTLGAYANVYVCIGGLMDMCSLYSSVKVYMCNISLQPRQPPHIT